jgi:glycosyltransferase involved in cell wall biosynthesis
MLALSDDLLPSSLPFAWEARLPRAAGLLRRGEGYDVVQVQMAGGGVWLERASGSSLRVFDAHNVEASFARKRAAGSRLRRRLAEHVVELEGRTVEASDLTIACTAEDAEELARLYGIQGRTLVAPNGFDDAILGLDREALGPRTRERLGARSGERLLLFVGGAADHNLEAVRLPEEWLVPRLGAGARLVIAGKAARALRSAHPAVTTPGYVPDLRDLLAAADVALNPVPYGSGANVKVAEYLAAGLPVVSSAVGARGFERFGDRILVAEPQELWAAVESAPEAGGAPAGIEELAWGRIGERLHDHYRRLLDRSRSAHRSS